MIRQDPDLTNEAVSPQMVQARAGSSLSEIPFLSHVLGMHQVLLMQKSEEFMFCHRNLVYLVH